MIIRSLVCLVVFGIGLSMGEASAQDRCLDILGDGIFEVSSGFSDQRAANSFTNWFSETTSSTRESAWDFEGTFKKYGVQAGYENYDDFESSVGRYSDGQSQEAERISTFTRLASSDITAVWSRCMDRAGAHVSRRLTHDPMVFWIVFKYVAAGTAQTSFNVSIDDSDQGVDCDSVPRRGRVGAAPVPVRCVRVNKDPASIAFVSDTGFIAGEVIFSLPEIVDPPDVPFADPNRFELVRQPVGDCDERRVSVRDSHYEQSFDITLYNNCEYIGWTEGDSRELLWDIARATGLGESASRWALLGYTPGYQDGGCDRRTFTLFDHSLGQIVVRDVFDNCDKINFGALPRDIAQQVASVSGLR